MPSQGLGRRRVGREPDGPVALGQERAAWGRGARGQAEGAAPSTGQTPPSPGLGHTAAPVPGAAGGRGLRAPRQPGLDLPAAPGAGCGALARPAGRRLFPARKLWFTVGPPRPPAGSRPYDLRRRPPEATFGFASNTGLQSGRPQSSQGTTRPLGSAASAERRGGRSLRGHSWPPQDLVTSSAQTTPGVRLDTLPLSGSGTRLPAGRLRSSGSLSGDTRSPALSWVKDRRPRKGK